MSLKISGHASPAGGPMRLKIGWPHDLENQSVLLPHEPANWHYVAAHARALEPAC